MRVLQAYDALEVPASLQSTFPGGVIFTLIEMGGAQYARMGVPGSKSGCNMLIAPKKWLIGDICMGQLQYAISVIPGILSL